MSVIFFTLTPWECKNLNLINKLLVHLIKLVIFLISKPYYKIKKIVKYVIVANTKGLTNEVLWSYPQNTSNCSL